MMNQDELTTQIIAAMDAAPADILPGLPELIASDNGINDAKYRLRLALEKAGRLHPSEYLRSSASVLDLESGEVIWSTTKESPGGKYIGSAADVADKVAKELLNAYRRAEKLARKP